MVRAKLTLTLPEKVWIGELSRTHHDVTFRVLAAFTTDDIGHGLIEIQTPNSETVISDMDAFEAVKAIELLHRGNNRDLIQFETTHPLLLLPAQDSGIPLEMPIEIKNGQATLEITAPQDRLSEFGKQLEMFDIPFSVEYLHQHVENPDFLTDQQLRVITTAVEKGYYDTPRECTLTNLAEDLDLAKSTVSETLHRAEGAIIKDFLR